MTREINTSLNTSSKTIYALITLVYIIMFAFNRLTPFLVDDFSYLYSYADGKRITSIGQIFPSMLKHYYTMNGRLVIHGIVQFMLMLPPIVFDLLNAGIFCLLCWTVYEYTWKIHHKEHNAFLFLAIVGSIWAFVPQFGQVFLWLDGACNYMWSTTLLLLYVRPVLTDWPHRKKYLFWAFYIITGFIMGGLLETVSFAVMVFFVLWAVCQRLFLQIKIDLWRICPAFVMLPGYLLMTTSPALKANKVGTKIYIGSKFVEAYEQYITTLKWLLIFGLIMAVILLTLNAANNRLWQAAVWFCLSFGMNCMHSVTTYYPKRSMIGVSLFLIIADGFLLSGLLENDQIKVRNECMNRVLANCLCSLALILAMFRFVPGSYDIYQTWKQIHRNEVYIQNEVASGRLEVTISTVLSETEYSGVNGLKYIDTNTYDTWPNNTMAKYYGAERIYGRNGN